MKKNTKIMQLDVDNGKMKVVGRQVPPGGKLKNKK